MAQKMTPQGLEVGLFIEEPPKKEPKMIPKEPDEKPVKSKTNKK